ncbi:MAG TPA: cupin domain-containing protein [Solirubrobacteraceae bacterium]|nr:cupin domain-containing protein [Solirubrobacteraceae bacterium]
MSYSLRTIDELESIHHGAVKLAGAELGIQSFGMQVLDFPAGFADYPEHDHADDGQEEVYLVLAGQADFVIDGEDLTLSPGQLLKVEPGTRRKLYPGQNGVRVLAIGCTPGRTYERPQDFRTGARV